MIELMSPSGGPESFIAALEAGADSVYLGIKKFNARKPAANFTFLQLQKACKIAREKNRKVYCVLNIDIRTNELKEILETLKTLTNSGVDALIIKDWGLYFLCRKYFKNHFELHLSTQACLESSLSVELAKELGFKRVVLARELTLEEIRSSSSIDGVETEIFIEGSMCFSISGRCLMSSWVGGRSGNRGACTAPCRMIWKNGEQTGNLFSMKDLSLFDLIEFIQDTGISALKIEGRLKTPGWVYLATLLYRKTLDHSLDENEKNNILNELRSFSARETGTGHLKGHKELTGENKEWPKLQLGRKYPSEFDKSMFNDENRMKITLNQQQISVSLKHNQQTMDLVMKQPPNPKKAKLYGISSIIPELGRMFSFQKAEIEGDGEFSSSQLNHITDQITGAFEELKRKEEETAPLNADELEFMENILTVKEKPRKLGELPDRIIILSRSLNQIREKSDQIRLITVMIDGSVQLKNIEQTARDYSIIISLPEMIYENEIPFFKHEIDLLIQAGFKDFEFNSLTGFKLLKDKNISLHAGQGISLMNPLAVKTFKELGVFSFYCSHEMDKHGIKLMAQMSEGRLGLIEYGYLPLFIARTERNSGFKSGRFQDKFTDIKSEKVFDTVYYSSMKPLNLIGREMIADQIEFDFLAADLRFSPDIQNDFKVLSGEKSSELNLFNYNRKMV